MSNILGIDVGGSGIKGAPVNLDAGDFAADRFRIPTPEKSTPQNVAKVIAEIIDHFSDTLGDSPIGLTIPAPVVHGKVLFIANLHKSWAGLEAEKFFSDTLGRHVTLVNDADAAGLAEVHFGAAKGHPGLVIMTTLGTGIGSAMIYRGVLIPNAELGHLEIDGYDAEKRAASSVKDKEGLSYEKWAKRLQRYYSHVEMLFSPDLFVVGGGVSRDSDQFLPLLKLRTPIVPAKMRNRAGIIGAALAAREAIVHPDPIHTEDVEQTPSMASRTQPDPEKLS
ncbi:ROK family protein [Tessaracoccus sp. OS52]|uniref:polyphosphate--glucose phosphotransferase n=1 Tax=Tessaracoccus sp. OS52 TaxID=2886691 RepID=UPI001D113A00|nr:ROK family protein [Tessaracoccus sp. OS52]MCC2594242.1 ROK family protein [Tessaracoccus sp. OS52]